MAAPIIVTKLFIPSTRAKLVQRHDLIERLNDGLDKKLTLISAPAGFGKTTLVSHWVVNLRDNGASNSRTIQVAWLSLDEDDNDRVRFLTYFVTALNQIKEIGTDLGQGALSMLQSPQPPPANTVLISLINDLAAIPQKIIFVLDDYHLIESEPIHQALVFLLENLPPQLHLVIATRQDPPLSLGRLRARAQMTELRAADLRFTSAEAADFLNRVMGLNLSSEDIAELETRTEGWIAGLQLAAISMRGHDDCAGFIKSFSGGHRLVLDFLIEEVLGQQTENIQNFLLQTAILDRMTGPLCDAVRFGNTKSPTSSTGTAFSGQESGQEILEMLDRANLFIVPLDDERLWYRYHHLFANLLRQRLKYSHKDQLESLHLRASEWYEQNHFSEEAIDHAFRSKNLRRAANLVAREAEDAWERNEEIKFRKWLDKLPEEHVFSNPQLWIFHAWRLFITGEHQAAEKMLENIENAVLLGVQLDPESTLPGLVQLDERDKTKLQGRIETIRGFVAAFRGNEQAMVAHLQRALDNLPDSDLSWRSMVANSLADIYEALGDMTRGYQTRMDALKISKAAGNNFQWMITNVKLAANYRKRGQLQAALDICQQQMQAADQSGMSQSTVVGWLMTIWGETLAEINVLKSAEQKVTRGIGLTEGSADVGTLGWSYLSLIRVLFSSGELTKADRYIRRMEKVARELDMLPWLMDSLEGWKVRIWLKRGNLDAAALWVKEQALDIHSDITSLDEGKFLAFARILIAWEEYEAAVDLLQELLESAEAGSYTAKAIEILILQALAIHADGDPDRAITLLESALILAEPSGFVRIFVDEGPPMASLLYEALKRGIEPEYVQRLLVAFPVKEPDELASTTTQDNQSGLIEPLSERETEVLQLLAKGLTNQAIADKLILSIHTIKTHTRNIYSKLNVNNRTQAVDRARTLGVLPPI